MSKTIFNPKQQHYYMITTGMTREDIIKRFYQQVCDLNLQFYSGLTEKVYHSFYTENHEVVKKHFKRGDNLVEELIKMYEEIAPQFKMRELIFNELRQDIKELESRQTGEK